MTRKDVGESGRSLFPTYDLDIRLEELRQTIIRMVSILAAVRTRLSGHLIRTEHLNLRSHKRNYNTEKWSEYLFLQLLMACLQNATLWWSWNTYNLKQLAMILNIVGEENRLLLLDIVKTSVWSGVRYTLPAETSSNNDVAHSGLYHVTLSAFKTRPRRPLHRTPSLPWRINAHAYS
jgi:hypothetical protein